jgi:hypothetical protein
MSEASASDDGFVPHIAHDEFRHGASRGRFRIVVNPTLAPYAVRRTRIDLLAAAIIGVGAVLALGGHAVAGIVLVALGIFANRVVRRQAGRILLHLASSDPAVYAEVTGNGVMEVRRA